MVADAYSVFVNMFLALDAAWESYEEEDNSLRSFLSEASPYTFLGKGSADPAIWAGFHRKFVARFSDESADLEDAHAFVVEYLGGMSGEYIEVFKGKVRLEDAFLEFAPLDRWLEVFELQEDE